MRSFGLQKLFAAVFFLWPAFLAAQDSDLGRIEIRCEPVEDCSIEEIDNQLLNGAREVVAIKGIRRIKVSAAGFESASLEVEVVPDATQIVEIVLERLTGKIRFESPRSWVRIEIDGQVLRARQGEWRVVPAGTHRIYAVAGRFASEATADVPAHGETFARLAWRATRPDPSLFVLLPLKSVNLGSARFAELNPPHVESVAGFWMQRTEVTVAQYRNCVQAGSCSEPAKDKLCNWGLPGREQHPVNCVSAVQAEQYARWMSVLEGLEYRLPTTDEWERSARVSSGGCNVCDTNCPWRWKVEGIKDGWSATSPAAALPACKSPEGVYDIIGNVAEWSRNPVQPTQYQVRGGSWGLPAVFLDPAYPNQKPRDLQDPNVGFRLVVPIVRR